MSHSPASLGFSMPAEWAPQDSIWLSWPLNESTWPDTLPLVQKQFAEFVATISRFEPVRINCALEAHASVRKHLEEAHADMGVVAIYPHPTNDVWCRDHGPTFITNKSTGELAVVDWQFNAWGGKFPPWDLDNAIPSRISESLGLRKFSSSLICEGGGIEVNGEGVLLTTESVMLNANRNPDWSKERIEEEFCRMLGVTDICWLPSGMVGDDTDGHIDTLARFFKEDGIVAIYEENEKDENYLPLRKNLDILKELRTKTGGSYEVVTLPMPDPIKVEGWREPQLPAGYANFLIINDAVLVPTYRQAEKDDEALGILRECFPDRAVIGLDCLDIVLEGGALHCLSQQMPLA